MSAAAQPEPAPVSDPDPAPASSARPAAPPRLASDVARGYLVLGLSIPVIVASPFVFALVYPDASSQMLSIGALFVGWSFIALASGISTVLVFRRAGGEELVRWLRGTTPTTRRAVIVWRLNGGGAVSWALTGSVLAVASVVILATSAELRQQPLVLFGGIAVVVSSMFMIITAYALRYARENAEAGGAEFPGTRHPRFVDYLYLAVQVSTTFSSSDVQVTTSAMRKAVSLNSIISFTFNTVIVALLVSVLVSTAG